MYELTKIPRAAFPGFGYLMISEIGSKLVLWIANNPIGKAHEIMTSEIHANRLWISALTPTPEADIYQLHEALTASGAVHDGVNGYTNLDFEKASDLGNSLGWGSGLLLFNVNQGVKD